MRKPILIILTAITIALTTTGCVNRMLAESYSQFLDSAGTEYTEYVANDPDLTPSDKELRQLNVQLANDTAAKYKNTKWSW